MAYKTILVYVDSGKRCGIQVELAVRLACQYDAHLVGLHAIKPVDVPSYAKAEAVGSIIELQNRAASERLALAEATFTNTAAAAGLATAEWRTTTADADEAIALHARYADLVVLGQPKGSDIPDLDLGFAEHVVLAAGRPVLMVPYAGSFETIGERVLVAWNASREAMRAVTDAIPLLRQASDVRIIVVKPTAGDHGAAPGNDIGLYLARHGVRVEVKTDHASEIDVGNELLSRAADFGADLIVMGAYGHSRWRERMMGGASRTIFDSMTVPVLLAH